MTSTAVAEATVVEQSSAQGVTAALSSSGMDPIVIAAAAVLVIFCVGGGCGALVYSQYYSSTVRTAPAAMIVFQQPHADVQGGEQGGKNKRMSHVDGKKKNKRMSEVKGSKSGTGRGCGSGGSSQGLHTTVEHGSKWAEVALTVRTCPDSGCEVAGWCPALPTGLDAA